MRIEINYKNQEYSLTSSGRWGNGWGMGVTFITHNAALEVAAAIASAKRSEGVEVEIVDLTEART